MTRVPSFPEFKRLDLADRQVIESYTCHFDPYSDLNFTSLWCWDTESEVEWSVLDGTLVVKLPNYGSDVLPRFTLLGGHDYSAKALRILSSAGSRSELGLVPEIVAQLLQGDDRFVVREDRDNADYVVDIAQFLERAGQQYENLRKKHSRFRRRTPTVVSLDVGTRHGRAFISDISRSWFAAHPPDSEDVAGQRESEAAAITRALSADLPLHGTGVLLDGEPYAFELWELVGSGWSHWALRQDGVRAPWSFLLHHHRYVKPCIRCRGEIPQRGARSRSPGPSGRGKVEPSSVAALEEVFDPSGRLISPVPSICNRQDRPHSLRYAAERNQTPTGRDDTAKITYAAVNDRVDLEVRDLGGEIFRDGYDVRIALPGQRTARCHCYRTSVGRSGERCSLTGHHAAEIRLTHRR